MRKNTFCTLAWTLLTAALLPLSAQDLESGNFWKGDDVVFELVGQVNNIPMTPTSLQFGYLTSITGLEGVFNTPAPTMQNQSTALFTFFNDSTTQRVIVNGNLRIVNRDGTTTVYHDTTPDGNFADPTTFQDGLAVQTSTFRHQVILDVITGNFTTVFVNEVTSVVPFFFNGQIVRLGKVGDKFRTLVSGKTIVPGTQFEIAGYAVAASKR
jgi:hypothetical protein